VLRNVFDADAREPSLAGGGIVNDLPVAPRAAYVQLQYRH
jgi:iron complex outermembrane receptor protein